MSETYLTPEEAAKRLKVSPKSIREWLRTNKLQGARTGRLWRIREDDLKTFLFGPKEPEVRPWDSLNREERIERIEMIQGKYVGGRPDTVDSFLRRKHAETDREERRREWRNMTREQRLARIESIQAMCADLDISTEKFLRHKREEVEREEHKRQQRQNQ